MVTLKTTIDGILANVVYNGNLIWLPTSPTMCLHQQYALDLKSTLTDLSVCPKSGTDNKTNPQKAMSR